MKKHLADELLEPKKQLKKDNTETYFKVDGVFKFKTEAEWNEFNQGMQESANREPVYNDSVRRYNEKYNEKVLNQLARRETVNEKRRKC